MILPPRTGSVSPAPCVHPGEAVHAASAPETDADLERDDSQTAEPPAEWGAYRRDVALPSFALRHLRRG